MSAETGDATAAGGKGKKVGSSSKSGKDGSRSSSKSGSGSGSSSKKSGSGAALKGKPGPEWKRHLDSVVVHAQVQGAEVAKQARAAWERLSNDAAFRQRAGQAALGALCVLVLLAVALRGWRGAGAAPGGAVLLRAGGGAGAGGGGFAAAPGGSAGAHKSPKSGLPSVLTVHKRDRERAEAGFDVSGSDLVSVKRRFGTRAEYEKAQASARGASKLPAKDEQCFRSMAVQVRRDSPKLSVYQPRKVFDLAVLQRAHKTLGFVEEADLKKASLALKGVPRVVFRQLKEGKQYYDMVASLGRIGSKKKTQLATLRNYVRKFKCSFESLHIQPRSYDMNRPSDCNKFFAHEDRGKMWVLKSCKAGEGSKGMGITVIDDLSASRTEFGACQENAMNYVAQAYIEQPLLVINRKFDMRVYIFVASTKPYVVYFNPGYIRRSLAEYKPKSTEKNDVLTNYHVQMTREDFTPDDAMWPFSKFVQYLKENDKCEACGDVEIQLSKIARLVFDAGRSYFKRWSGSFQLVGLDFMMDQYLNVNFIEGNVSPGLGNHGLKWKRELMDDLILLMYEQTVLIHERPQEYDLRIGERVYGKYSNYWEVIVNEQHEKCNKQAKFDPCKELKLDGVVDDEINEPQDDAPAADDAEPDESPSGAADSDAGGGEEDGEEDS